MGTRESWSSWKKVFDITGRKKPYLHLERASSEGICFCKCKRALVAVPDQLDCPWCGCGWLFMCVFCGKAFTYAKAVPVNTPLAEIVERDLVGRGWEKDRTMTREGVTYMKWMLEQVQEGVQYGFLDGLLVPMGLRNIKLDGRSAVHRIKILPHERELKTPGSLMKELSRVSYWTRREHKPK